MPGWVGQDATPTVQFLPYPQQAADGRPGPYGYATGYDGSQWSNRSTQAQPAEPSGYSTGYAQPDWYNPPTPVQPAAVYPPPPQYDPGSGTYRQHQAPQYGQQVVYQTVVQHVPIAPPRSMGVAYVLWFFLGFFGVHHFYLGRNGQGLAYLLLTVLLGWVGLGLLIVGIALLVDLFLIPTYTRDANYRLTGYRF